MSPDLNRFADIIFIKTRKISPDDFPTSTKWSFSRIKVYLGIASSFLTNTKNQGQVSRLEAIRNTDHVSSTQSNNLIRFFGQYIFYANDLELTL